jgi:hypothetical protein
VDSWLSKSLSKFPYQFSPRETTVFIEGFIPHWFVPPIRHSVLGRTFCTFPHYVRSYPKSFYFWSFRSKGPCLTFQPKKLKFPERFFQGYIPWEWFPGNDSWGIFPGILYKGIFQREFSQGNIIRKFLWIMTKRL